MSDLLAHCPTCGSTVYVVSSDEGTSHYRPRDADVREELTYLLRQALTTDGGHHKQWYLEQIAEALDVDVSVVGFERGIAP